MGKGSIIELGGSKIEVHPIGTLAKRIGRSSLTIRRWERTGVIPSPSFRRGRWRMYTNDEIDLLASLVEEVGLKRGVQIETTDFKQKATVGMKQLKAKYKRMSR
jgi:hypothetical protein